MDISVRHIILEESVDETGPDGEGELLEDFPMLHVAHGTKPSSSDKEIVTGIQTRGAGGGQTERLGQTSKGAYSPYIYDRHKRGNTSD